MKRKLPFLIAILFICYLGYTTISADFTKTEDTIYINGNIITLENERPIATAMFIKNGLIEAIGNHKEVIQFKNDNVAIVDLKGATILPGFIDSHSHVALSSFLDPMIDLSGFKHQTNAEVWNYLKEQLATKKEGEWIVCKGIDPILIKDLITPNIHFLDSISPKNPIFLISQSVHTYWANTQAFSRSGITQKTKNPSKTSYYERDAAGNLTGLIAEQEAVFPILEQLRKEVLSPKSLINSTVNVLQAYAKNGNTTVVSAGILINDDKPLRLYKHLSTKKTSFTNQLLATFGVLPKRSQYPRHFIYIRHDRTFLLPKKKDTTNDFYNILGVKHWYDGSPYTGSMFIDKPYIISELTKNGLHIPEGYAGKPLIKETDLLHFIKKHSSDGWQIAVHSQGDISSQQVLKAFDTVNKEINTNTLRHRLEHCLLLTEKSLSEMKRMNITPSFHINHLYYYGNALADDIIGAERAQKILPVGTAQKLNMNYSMHADQPMFESKPFHLIQTAILRQTKEGDTLGMHQKITLLEGLKAMTINAAWQLHMEDKIGSLKNGKYADFIILNQDPFKTAITELHTIKIAKTFINGNEVK